MCKLDQIKVYCCECDLYKFRFPRHTCTSEDFEVCEPERKYWSNKGCKVKNKNNNCKDFIPMKTLWLRK